ncbi:helix-hairpin-helix domain-containing protein [Actinobacillus pleuropneumoniae]|uniref:helix-hairpin-helix domain-containing protein n=2 Tax=Actinobacillus pleuropneumoniae TaxID=715 RepID=UPI000045D913|nr:tRNA delta(2)-isopentenylpyrophosphate transferase [Actinobacillus pleuropneumoniae]UKH11297.1 tRNA delta(2)-isopentenylpyrophosphate transferase [Actinobacillus pleuropneumoniae]VTR45482.1 Uncharacterised protein [Actinobacillus pleuropneumoniae]
MAKEKKKRNKKHDPKGWAKKKCKVAMDGSYFMSFQAMGRDGEFFVYNNRYLPMNSKGSEQAFHEFFITPHAWTITAGVVCRDQFGYEYQKFSSQTANNHFIYHDPEIQQWILDFTADRINEVNKEHIVSSFFIMNPSGYQFNENELSRMYRWSKIYDKSKYLTRYECQQIGKQIDDFLLRHPLSEKLENHIVKKLTDAGFGSWMKIYTAEIDCLKAIKGIGEKREKQIIGALVELLKSNDEILELSKEYSKQNVRVHQAKRDIERQFADSEAVYQMYLEMKASRK